MAYTEDVGCLLRRVGYFGESGISTGVAAEFEHMSWILDDILQYISVVHGKIDWPFDSRCRCILLPKDRLRLRRKPSSHSELGLEG